MLKITPGAEGLKQQSVCGVQSQPCQSWRLAGHPTKREELGDEKKEQEEEPEKEKEKEPAKKPAEEKETQEEEEKEKKPAEEREPQEEEEKEGARRREGGAALYLKFDLLYVQYSQK
jgi:hypothetical protein